MNVHLGFTRGVNSVLDVKLDAIVQLMKQQGFELTDMHSTNHQAYQGAANQMSGGIAPAGATQSAAVPPAPAPATTKATKATKAAEAAPPTQTGPAKRPDPAAPRTPEGAALHAHILKLLNPFAEAGHADAVMSFFASQGYGKLSEVPDELLPAFLAAAEAKEDWPDLPQPANALS